MTKDKFGKVVWLEEGGTGQKGSGLAHIIENHAEDFARQGVGKNDIPNYVMDAITNGKVVGYQGRGTGRPIYQFEYNGEIREVAITIGDNGYVVGANPK